METDVDMSRPLADGASPTDDWARIARHDDDGIADDDRDVRSRAGGPDPVLIELSRAQVDRIVRNAADGGSMSVLLSGLKDIRSVLAREPRQLEDGRLSRSLLAGLLMLASFPSDGSYLGNAEIARLLDMNPSTTHRYVSTLVAVGLLERDPATRRYRLT
jgi:IclR-like helix-turn-helix domain-containing protein